MDEEVKLAMKRAKKAKEERKQEKARSKLEGSDTFYCFHSDEAKLIEALLYDVLEKDADAVQIYPNEKRIALNALKHMNGGIL